MAGILDYLGGGDPGTSGGILGTVPQMQPWQQPLGMFGSALKDAGAFLSGHPADANNAQQYSAQMQKYQLMQAAQQARVAATSSDPAIRQKGYAAYVALGADPTSLQKMAAQSAMPQLLQNLQPSQGFNDNPVAVTPQVTQNPTLPQQQATQAAQATNAAPAMSMQPSTLAGALQRTGSPELSADLAPDIVRQQMQMQAKQVRPATAAENIAHGRKATDPGDIDAYGNYSSDVKSQAAVDQSANAPLTKMQLATIADAHATEGETARHNRAEENIAINPLGMGLGGPAKTGADGKPLSGPDYLATLNPQVALTVKAIGDGRMAPVSGFALAKPQGMAIMAAVNQYNPTYDATSMPTRQAARRDFITGADGKSLTAINTAVDHLDSLGHLATALGNGDIQAVNSIGQGFAQQTGSPAPTNFDTAKQVVGDEIVKALVGSGGAQADRDAAKATVNRASSPQQLAGAIQTYQNLLAGKLGPLRQKYQTNTKLQDFDDQLTPNTRAVLGALPQGEGGGKSAAPPNPASLPRVGAAKVIKYDAQGNRTQ